MVKPSYVNVTVHKTGTYLSQDPVAIRVLGDYTVPFTVYFGYRDLLRDKANAPDKFFDLQTWYQSPSGLKLYFEWDIIRNGSIISTRSDSTDQIQYSIKNFTLNY